MVLAGGQGLHVTSVAHDDKAGLLTCKNSSITTRAVAPAYYGAGWRLWRHGVDGCVRLLNEGGDNHAFACSQAVGLTAMGAPWACT